MITALDQQIAKVLNGNTKSGDKIQGLISLLREQDQTIANLEDHNKTLRDCLRTRNELIAQYEDWNALDASKTEACPVCEEHTTPEELAKWEMCHNCERQDGEY